ncbi:MAG: sigma-54-dependent Fis family transcriptional regulator [Rhizobacter sp.]
MSNALIEHIDNVINVGSNFANHRSADALIHKSWTRCIKQHGLDPSRPKAAHILPFERVREHQQRLEGFIRVARAGMEDMYRRVADLGYMMLLTDSDGVTVDYIGNPASEKQLKAAGLYLGADWNEAHAGTCGVGTCLIEQEIITCHQAEHFDATHIGLTCTSAPLFTPDGQLLAVLDVSALHSPEAKESQHLVFHLTSMYGQMIEDANFLRHFDKQWILRLGNACGLVEVSGNIMLAFDDDGLIVGANTGARKKFAAPGVPHWASNSLVGQTVMDLLETSMDELSRLAKGGTTMELSGIGAHLQDRQYATVIPPRNQVAVRAIPAMDTPLALAAVQTKAESRDEPLALDRLAGSDPTMQNLIRQAKRLVDRKVNILIQGETGSGKEVFAKALHGYSRRARKPFVAVNCASIPESLIESELFGYMPGSFTGGRSKGMKGLILQSEGGSLFLDEIGDMPLQLQTRFLRVLSENEVLPLGADHPIAVNCTVIAATHRDLRDQVEAGTFREDLYYRLCGATLSLPALRDRADQRYLIESIFQDEARRLHSRSTLSSAIVDRLTAYRWPGNVRELRSALRFAIALSDDAPVTLADLPDELCLEGHSDRVRPTVYSRSVCVEAPASLAPETGADSSERLLNALKRHKWNVTRAADELDLCRATIYRQMKRFGITAPNQL